MAPPYRFEPAPLSLKILFTQRNIKDNKPETHFHTGSVLYSTLIHSVVGRSPTFPESGKQYGKEVTEIKGRDKASSFCSCSVTEDRLPMRRDGSIAEK